MPTFLHREEIQSPAQRHVIDITELAEKAVANSGFQAGIVTAFAQHTTVGVTAMEYEPGTVLDLAELWERLVPQSAPYHHNRLNADTNGHSHAQAALLGPSVTVPFTGGRLLLGTWQAVVAVDFDDRPRHRQVLFQVIGE